MSFTEFHGITMAQNSFIENLVVENLASDPSPVEAGRIWFNTTEKQYKASTLDIGGAVIIQVLGGKEQLDQYILDLASQVRGDGSALVGYAGVAGTNGKFSTSADTAEATFDALTQGIDATNQSIADLGTGTLTAIQNEVDAVETGAGLNTDGTYTSSVGSNYAGAASSIKVATEMLDAQVKVNADDIVAEENARVAADALKVNKAGDTMTGALAMTNNRITNLANPTDDYDATNKLYVDTAVQGIDWKDSVRATSTSDIVLSGLQTIDDVVLVEFDRVLVQGQTVGADNGLYEVRAAAWVRTADADGNPDSEVSNGLAVFVEEGTLSASNGYVLTTPDPIVVGTDALVFSQFSGAGQVIAGAGISKTGNELFVNFGAGVAQLPSDEVGIDVLPTGGVFTTIDGTNSSVAAGSQLSVLLDGTTLTRSVNGLKITDAYTQARVDAETTLNNEIDRIETAAGLNADGTYTADGSSNYLTGVANLKAADSALDAKVKVNEDGLAAELIARAAADAAIQTELDDTQTGAGLGADGAYVANAGANYISSATSLKDADTKLDAQVKTNTDDIASEITDRGTAITALKSAINANTYTFDATTEATSFIINHALNSAFVTVAMWVDQGDGTYKNDIAQITLTDNNNFTINLTVAKKVRVVVTSPADV